MHYSLPLLSLAGLASAYTPFPLSNGFPNPNPAAIKVIEQNAGGTLPNTALPTKITPTDVHDFQLLVVQETFEVAYFTSLLNNITNNVPGYECVGFDKNEVEAIFFEIRAQEEVHVLGLNAILQSVGEAPVQPCEYMFPVDNFIDAVALAAEFTDVVLGALQGVQNDLATGGGQGQAIVPLFGSIIAQEGEQVGFFRFAQRKVPSSAPFLTSVALPFAVNALVQNFIVPGSCPNPPKGIPTFAVLTPETQPGPANTTVTYSTTAAVTSANYIAYISGQNTPVVVPVSGIKKYGSKYTFSAEFPFGAGFSKGLTIAALTKNKGPFTNASTVADATIAGPGLIEVD